MDIQRDLLQAVTGKPVDTSDWGTRVAGADALYLNVPMSIQGLGDLCRNTERAYRRKDYEARFSWIDNIIIIEDPDLRESLEGIVLSRLTERHVEGLTLAPPELVIWCIIRSMPTTESGACRPPNPEHVDHRIRSMSTSPAMVG